MDLQEEVGGAGVSGRWDAAAVPAGIAPWVRLARWPRSSTHQVDACS